MCAVCSLTLRRSTANSADIRQTHAAYLNKVPITLDKTNRPLGILFSGEINNAYVLLPIFRPAASKLVIGH